MLSIGQISSRTNARIQSSCSWNSGSVEKSHAMRPPFVAPASHSTVGCVTPLLLAAGAGVVVGAALQSATGFGFAVLAAPLMFAALEPREAIGLLLLLGMEIGVLTLATEGRRPRPDVPASARILAWSVPGAVLGVVGAARARRDGAAGGGLRRRARDAGRAPAAARSAARTSGGGRRPRRASPPAGS